MKTYLHCGYDECVARASAYHRVGHEWARSALTGGDVNTVAPPGVFQLAQAHGHVAIIDAAGLLAEAYSYMVDCVEGDLTALDDEDLPAHVDAAVTYAARGLHCDEGDHRVGVDWMDGCRCCTAALASALLGDWRAIMTGAETNLAV